MIPVFLCTVIHDPRFFLTDNPLKKSFGLFSFLWFNIFNILTQMVIISLEL